jgi:hypothetical protein
MLSGTPDSERLNISGRKTFGNEFKHFNFTEGERLIYFSGGRYSITTRGPIQKIA